MVYKYSKGESNGKAETEFSGLPWPSRILSSTILREFSIRNYAIHLLLSMMSIFQDGFFGKR